MKFAQWKPRSLFFLALILIYLVHFSILTNGYKVQKFVESSSIYQIYDIKSYNDGTVLLHLINGNIENCTKPELYFRLIYPNGTFKSLNIPAKQIPRFNFCQVINKIVYRLYIKVWPLKHNLIYVTYLNSDNIKNASVYGLLIDWNGKILSNSFISTANVGFNGTAVTILPPSPLYYSEEFIDNGFIYVGKQNTSDLHWLYFTFPTSKTGYLPKLLRKGVIKGDGAKDFKFFGFFQITNGYYLITAKTFNHPNVKTFDLANINLRVEVYFITVRGIKDESHFIEARGIKDPSANIIYESPIRDLDVVTTSCGMDIYGGGISCLLYLNKGNGTYGLRIVFRTTGATRIVKEIPAVNVTGSYGVTLNPLGTGGYLLTASYYRPNYDQMMYGYLLNATGGIVSNWTLPQPINFTARGRAYDVLPNDTFLTVLQPDNRNFSIITEGLPKIPAKNKKNLVSGFFNPLILSTYPPINGTVPLRRTEINLTYVEPVVLSTRKVTIYQYNASDSGFTFLRQKYSAYAGFVKLSNDNKTLTFRVFKSTFNKPETNYSVKLESDVTRFRDTGEPVLGIPNDIWKFTTEKTAVAVGLGRPVIGFIRLSPEGTNKFNALDKNGKSNFTNNLGRELASTVPISKESIAQLNRYQKDQRTEGKGMLIAYKVVPVIGVESADDIANDLQDLISNGESTLVSRLDYTRNLDYSYGFVRKHDIFQDNRVQLILFAAYIIALIILVFIIFFLTRQASVGAVLKFILAFIAFSFVIWFNEKYSRDVEELTIASLLFLIVPFIIKLGLGIYILSRESNINKRFHTWVEQHIIITALFGFLSAIDLDAITTLGSRIDNIFNAPLSRGSLSLIGWLEFAGLFLKDLPLLAIQVLYYKWALDYEIIPFFALITLLILIIYVMIWRIFRVCTWCFRKDEDDVSSFRSWLKKFRTPGGVGPEVVEKEADLGPEPSGPRIRTSRMGSLLKKIGLGGLAKYLGLREHKYGVEDESGATGGGSGGASEYQTIYQTGGGTSGSGGYQTSGDGGGYQTSGGVGGYQTSGGVGGYQTSRGVGGYQTSGGGGGGGGYQTSGGGGGGGGYQTSGGGGYQISGDGTGGGGGYQISGDGTGGGGGYQISGDGTSGGGGYQISGGGYQISGDGSREQEKAKELFEYVDQDGNPIYKDKEGHPLYKDEKGNLVDKEGNPVPVDEKGDPL